MGLDPGNLNDRAMVTVKDGVKGVDFENLSITGSERRGLELVEETFTTLTDCRVSGNGFRGLLPQVGGR